MSDDREGVFLPESDDAYAAWVHAHPRGYVVNKTGADSMMWHRADCGHIKPDGVLQFVPFKACAADPGELAMWAKSQPEALTYCSDCRIKAAKEQ